MLVDDRAHAVPLEVAARELLLLDREGVKLVRVEVEAPTLIVDERHHHRRGVVVALVHGVQVHLRVADLDQPEVLERTVKPKIAGHHDLLSGPVEHLSRQGTTAFALCKRELAKGVTCLARSEEAPSRDDERAPLPSVFVTRHHDVRHGDGQISKFH